MSPYLQNKAPRGDDILFIIAKTKGGIPVAVRRVVNPVFPVEFALNPDDLIVPGAQPKERLWLQAQLNTHGKAGAPAKGDLEGVFKNSVRPGKRGVRIIIDREI